MFQIYGWCELNHGYKAIPWVISSKLHNPSHRDKIHEWWWSSSMYRGSNPWMGKMLLSDWREGENNRLCWKERWAGPGLQFGDAQGKVSCRRQKVHFVPCSDRACQWQAAPTNSTPRGPQIFRPFFFGFKSWGLTPRLVASKLRWFLGVWIPSFETMLFHEV